MAEHESGASNENDNEKQAEIVRTAATAGDGAVNFGIQFAKMAGLGNVAHALHGAEHVMGPLGLVMGAWDMGEGAVQLGHGDPMGAANVAKGIGGVTSGLGAIGAVTGRAGPVGAALAAGIQGGQMYANWIQNFSQAHGYHQNDSGQSQGTFDQAGEDGVHAQQWVQNHLGSTGVGGTLADIAGGAVAAGSGIWNGVKDGFHAVGSFITGEDTEQEKAQKMAVSVAVGQQMAITNKALELAEAIKADPTNPSLRAQAAMLMTMSGMTPPGAASEAASSEANSTPAQPAPQVSQEPPQVCE
jgi:hypothetical protein